MQSFKKQFGTIVATAFCAALIAGLQSIIAGTGVCTDLALDPTNTGLIGAGLKTVHSTLQLTRFI